MLEVAAVFATQHGEVDVGQTHHICPVFPLLGFYGFFLKVAPGVT
jgi:hypothetical protein